MNDDKDIKDDQTPAEGDNTDKPAEGQTAPTEPADDGLPKSQDELDKLIEKRLKKEQKKWEKAQSAPADKKQDTPAADAAPDLSAELSAARAELREARAQSTAAKMGFKTDCIEDAVYLALREADKSAGGDPDEDDIKTALSNILKKHPEWKNDAGRSSGGFRVGAPQPQTAAVQKAAASKKWNKINY